MWAEYVEPGDRGFAHLAAHGRHRRAVLVAQGRHGCRFHVRAHGGGEPPAGLDRRPAPHRLSADARPPGRRAGPPSRCGCWPMRPKPWASDRAPAPCKYTSLVPLNRFVDAARPESESVRALEQAAARVARGAGGGDLAALRDRFSRWAANDAKFTPGSGKRPARRGETSFPEPLRARRHGASGARLLGAGRTPAFRLAGAADQRTGAHRPRDHGGAQTERRGGIGCRAPRQDPHRRPLKSPKMKMFQGVAPPPPLKLRLPFAGPISINRP